MIALRRIRENTDLMKRPCQVRESMTRNCRFHKVHTIC